MPNRTSSIARQAECSNVIALGKTTMLIEDKAKQFAHRNRFQTTAWQPVKNRIPHIPRPCSRFGHQKYLFLGRFLSCLCERDLHGIRNVRNPVCNSKSVRRFKSGKKVLGGGHFHLKEARLIVCGSQL